MEDRRHRRGFGAMMTGVVKDATLRQPLISEEVKFDGNSSGNVLFRDDNSIAGSTSESNTSLFIVPTTVQNNLVNASPVQDTSSSMMDTSLDTSLFNESMNLTGIDYSSSDVNSENEFAQIFDECVVNNFEDTSSLFTPQTYTHSTMTQTIDSPSITLGQVNNTTSLTDQDFDLFCGPFIHHEEYTSTPLFSNNQNAFISPYEFFNTATVTSSPHPQSTISSTTLLPSPALSPPINRKPSHPRTNRKSSNPFTPITPAPTMPSTPHHGTVTHATKRRIPVTGEDPAIVEKRRRNTIAAQRSRARKAEEKAEDKLRIVELERELENLKQSVGYWRRRAMELGASEIEDGE